MSKINVENFIAPTTIGNEKTGFIPGFKNGLKTFYWPETCYAGKFLTEESAIKFSQKMIESAQEAFESFLGDFLETPQH